MKQKRVHISMAILALFFISIACISFNNNQVSEEDIATQLTLAAIQQTQTAVAKPAEPADEPPPSDDESGDDAQAPDTDEDGTPCNRSKFVSETIPDNTSFQPGESFEKTWTVRNNGSCSWSTNYKFKFTQGDQMGGAGSQNLPSVIDPGETVTMSLNLTAPNTPGAYSGRWEFFDDEGNNFGWYSVVINVPGAAPAAFAVTSVSYSIPATTFNITCPGNKVVDITAHITTSAGGTVSFKWDDSQGCLGGCATKSIQFAGAETKSVTHSMTVGAAGDYWAKIYIDNPNHQWFGPQNFHVNCN